MKYIKLIIWFLLLGSFSQIKAELQSDIVIQKYRSGDQNYIEIYTYIINPYKSLSLEATRNIESLVVISNDDKIILAEKYLYAFSSEQKEDVIDVKRFQLEPGNYTVRVELIDLEDIDLYKDHSSVISIESNQKTVSTSDLYLGFRSNSNSPSLQKSGVSVEPMVFDFCRNQENMIAYLEVYNLDQTDHTMFAGFKLHRKLGPDSSEVVFKKYEKLKNESFYPILTQFPMGDVISGAYEFSVELTNKKAEVILSLSRSFDVSNAEADVKYEMSYNLDFENSWVQELDAAQLEYSLKAIFPKLSFTTTDVLNYILEQKDLKVKRYFLYNFWVGQSEQFPEQLYYKYMEIAKAVDKTYQKNVGFGFESDRGYVFLKYGKPNNIVSVEDEPTAPPYEIWIYNYLEETKQTDVKFLFYNKTLAANDMQLLHSTVRGEYANPRWELELYGDDPSTAELNQIDGRSATPGFNRRAREYFTDF